MWAVPQFAISVKTVSHPNLIIRAVPATVKMDHDAEHDYEEDDMLSFANPHYDEEIESEHSIHDNRFQSVSEYDRLLRDDYKELSLSPESFNGRSHENGNESNVFEEEVDQDVGNEDIYKALDEFYVRMEKPGGEKRENAKRRQKYASIKMGDMGILQNGNHHGMDSEISPRQSEPSSPSTGSGRDELLPHGWEKHEDDDGPYYWHIRTGTIQRHPPEYSASDSDHSVFEFPLPAEPVNSYGSSPTYPTSSKDEPKRYSVRSLGWTEIEEESLTPEKSSRAVNRCILNLSAGKNDTLDAVGRWGDGKDIFLELYPDKICLVDSVDSVVLHMQPIQTIRVWGVGRDDSRDFAFVAWDEQTGAFRCHVLRCDMPARRIAHALREICQQYIAQHAAQKASNGTPQRPHTLSLGRRRGSLMASGNVFPTPTEEPKKVFKVLYMGRRSVRQGVGIEALHSVIEQLRTECPEEQWVPVSVAVSPSTITIITQEEDLEVIAECRVRYLTFLGIGNEDVRTCGFIVHTPEDTFLAHVFACTPSGGPLCKAIEAACKLRYQKFLDAHSRAMAEAENTRLATPTERISAKLKSLFGSVASHLRTS